MIIFNISLPFPKTFIVQKLRISVFDNFHTIISAYGRKERTKNTVAKTKNPKARKNFNNYIKNKEVKSSNNWVCINVLIWN